MGDELGWDEGRTAAELETWRTVADQEGLVPGATAPVAAPDPA
jgi:hypothetical protein